jgi:hypothetical protein
MQPPGRATQWLSWRVRATQRCPASCALRWLCRPTPPRATRSWTRCGSARRRAWGGRNPSGASATCSPAWLPPSCSPATAPTPPAATRRRCATWTWRTSWAARPKCWTRSCTWWSRSCRGVPQRATTRRSCCRARCRSPRRPCCAKAAAFTAWTPWGGARFAKSSTTWTSPSSLPAWRVRAPVWRCAAAPLASLTVLHAARRRVARA